ncbi:mitochondrial fission protein ELM1 [Heracleum sosnowskyi]|uniref:Mitochondrial fission protein ELM1 n=1 Tax=Heracleum sosnowskyi TaxID=360622 RepID=A0AAD8GSV1_9APIA|nr:mitochondrial fission protein ELM1 [Heracleum sosnowskyi]
MKPIRLPEPPGSPTKSVPDIFEAGVYSVIRRAVIIGNGYEVSENQSIGLVQALGLSEKQVLYRVSRPRGGINEWLLWLPVFIHKKVYYIIRQLFRYSQVISRRGGDKLLPFHPENGGSAGLSSVLEADVKSIVTMARDTSEDGPLLVVACGRDTSSIASSIKLLSSDNVFVIQIQHPRSSQNRFDLVITPQHDYHPLTASAQEQVPNFIRKWISPREPPDRHVVLTVGALHQVDFASLRTAAIAWHDEFAPLPKPLLVVNIGSPTCFCNYGEDLAKQLVASLYDVLASCGSVRISFSRRTPEKVSNVVLKQLGGHPKVFIWDGEEPNPHMGHLAWADAFIVTADSVSMLSETCSTGKPVYVIGGERCTSKHAEFHKMIRERGLVRPFTGLEDISKSWSYPPLNDTAEAANRVREAIAERGWSLRT